MLLNRAPSISLFVYAHIVVGDFASVLRPPRDRQNIASADYVDIMRREPLPSIPERLLSGRCNLIFFNVARDPEIIEPHQRDRFFGTLIDLNRLLADNGTLVMAMNIHRLPWKHIEGKLRTTKLKSVCVFLVFMMPQLGDVVWYALHST